MKKFSLKIEKNFVLKKRIQIIYFKRTPKILTFFGQFRTIYAPVKSGRDLADWSSCTAPERECPWLRDGRKSPNYLRRWWAVSPSPLTTRHCWHYWNNKIFQITIYLFFLVIVYFQQIPIKAIIYESHVLLGTMPIPLASKWIWPGMRLCTARIAAVSLAIFLLLPEPSPTVMCSSSPSKKKESDKGI